MRMQFFDDSSDMYKAPADVRLRSVDVRPYPDGRRVYVSFDITPFREKPSLEVTILNNAEEPVASLNVIETLAPTFDITMHLRDGGTAGSYQLRAVVYYGKPGEPPTIVDRGDSSFEVPSVQDE